MELPPTDVIRGPIARFELVSALLNSPDSFQEAHWIEWKSAINLESQDWWFKVAKSVLAFANRPVDLATRVAQGQAFFLAGVQPGRLDGVETIDRVFFDQKLGQYLGQDGPHFEVDFVVLGAKEVLVVIIDPSAPGDPIRTLRKTYGSFEEGAIFIRRGSQTIRANATEIGALQNRLLERGGGTPQVRVESEAQPLRAVAMDDGRLSNFVEVIRRQLLQAATTGHPLLNYTMTKPAEEYQAEVHDFCSGVLRTAELGAIEALVEKEVNLVRLHLYNDGDEYLERVGLRIELPPGWTCYGPGCMPSFDYDQLPSPSNISSLLETYRIPSLQSSGVTVESSQEAELVRFANVNLPPFDDGPVSDIFVFPRLDFEGNLAIPWRVSAKGSRGLAQGSFTLHVADEHIDGNEEIEASFRVPS